jgi:hypothetical protein
MTSMKKVACITASLGAGLASMAVASLGIAPAATAGTAAPQPAWRVVDSITSSSYHPDAFTAVVATGKTSGYVFENTPKGELAYQRTGATSWKKVSFPGNRGVSLAEATSPTDVWAFGNGVEELTGGTWKTVKVFNPEIASATVLSSKDVWLFGTNDKSGATKLGVYHYNGRTWTRVSGTLGYGYAVSDHDVWASAIGGVENYNGHKWTATSLAGLLPAKDKNDEIVDGIIALSAKNVYALDSDFAVGRETAALYVLHFDGHKWSKVAENYGFSLKSLSPDGKGGFYFTAFQHDGGNPALLHYSDGKLTDVPQFTSNPTTGAYDVTHILGTTQQLVAILEAKGSKADAQVLQGS